MRTEDQVRSEAELVLGFNNSVPDVEQGVGQITTFNTLGFPGVLYKPDGWYLPKDVTEVAIILETKSESTKISKPKIKDELLQNCDIARTRYDRVVGILYNGKECIVYKNNVEDTSCPKTLQPKKYYLELFDSDILDKELIYNLTAKINNCLHTEFGIKNLYHRMIFTACALVAKRYGAVLTPGMDYTTFHTAIHSTLSKSLIEAKKQNQKLDILLEVYSEIKMNSCENQVAINNFIEWVSEISSSINSSKWNGEDVMGIFFNEFNRYKKKSESGQVFTPDHITSLMYRILEVSKKDRVLDATCGSGAFLVKAMSNMINEVGGPKCEEAKKIKANNLYGIEFDREIFALSCANMLIHKDGKTNIEQMDARTSEAARWIQSKNITKVLMNPPYETKYGCMKIVKNVLDSVPEQTDCAFILPDKKLEKSSKTLVKEILDAHTLKKIIKLPESLFFGVGVKPSIFIFKTGTPQNKKDIYGCYIEDDGFATVKNQGRHDVTNTWKEKEDYWVDSIYKQVDTKYGTGQWINPEHHLSYQVAMPELVLTDKAFLESTLEYTLFKKGMSKKTFIDTIYNSLFDEK